jgi:hypothetical protein
MEEPKEITVVEEPQMEDELATLSGEQLIENLENDIKTYEKALEQAIRDKENYAEQFEVDKQILAIIEEEGSLEMLRPTYKYQADERFRKLQEKKQKYANRQNLATGEGQLKSMDAQITNITQALESAKERLARFSEKGE